MLSVAEKYLRIQSEIEDILRKSGRPPLNTKILVVSKGQEAKTLQELVNVGQEDFGENYVQEWKEKKQSLANSKVQWHFIGRLQSNKLKYLIGEIALFHSLDRWDLALKMEEVSQKKNVKTSVLIEVDLAQEATKTGVSEEKLKSFVEKLNSLENLELKGLMLFPPLAEDPETSRPYFKHLREILFEFNQKNVYKKPLSELSMGMSNDYLVAVEEGATCLRIGRAIFNESKI